MVSIVEVKGIPLTRELAQEHYYLTPMPGEREVKAPRMKFLAGLLANHAFKGTTWAVGRERQTGMLYRLDGQHSSKLLAELEGEFPDGLVANMTLWEFDSFAEDAALLFNMFNNPRSGRTNEDVMGVYRAQVPELAHLSRAFLIQAANAINQHEHTRSDDGAEDAVLLGPRERGEYFVAVPNGVPITLWLARFLDTKNASFLSRPEVGAEMIQKWKLDAEAATEFWDYVFRENHPDPDDETRRLAEQYKSWAQQRHRRSLDYRKKAVAAWKAFYKRRQERGTPVSTYHRQEVETMPPPPQQPDEPQLASL